MSPGRLRVPRWLARAYAAVVVVALAWVLVDAGPELMRWRSLLASPGAYAFVASWVGMAALLGALWALLLRFAYGCRLGWREWLPLQAFAWSGRYLPGKFGLLAGKAVLSDRAGLGWRRVGFSVLYEQLAFVVAGIAVGLLLLPGPELLPEAVRPPWLVANWKAIAVAAAVACIAGFLAGIAWLARREAIAASLGVARNAALVALYMAPHLLVGLAAYALLVELAPAAATLGPWAMMAVLALAHVSGILAVFAPAGLGVRELVLAAGLAAALPLPEALAFAALLRILSVLADVVFVGVGAVARLRAAPQKAGPH